MSFADLRPILLIHGILLIILGGAMLIPGAVDYFTDNPDWQVFVTSALITEFGGFSLYFSNRGYKGTLGIRQAFLLTASVWFGLPIFAGLPLMFSTFDLNFTRAYFEVTSGLTTTGSTVIVGLDHSPPGILLWRSLMTALGGMGIVVLGLAILPTLRIGGMQLFRTESSDTTEKILPRITQIAKVIIVTFLVLSALCALCYWAAGMSGFDAICHAFPTIATAGFANYDNSFVHFNSPAIEAVAIFFMLASALPMILYYQALHDGPRVFWRDTQVKSFLGMVLVMVGIIAAWLVIYKGFSFFEAIRYSAFNIVEVITTTGFSSTDYALWGNFPTTLIFMLLVVGGCTGSTTGGIKMFRFQVMYETAKANIQQLLQPHGVFIPHYNHKPLPDHVINAVMNFFICFAFSFLVLAVAVSFFDIDFLTSMSAVAQAMANVGPGLGPIIGPMGNFSTLPDGALWILSFAMILGRLELFTVLVLFSSKFWRD